MMVGEASAQVLLISRAVAGSCWGSDSMCGNAHVDSRAIQSRR